MRPIVTTGHADECFPNVISYEMVMIPADMSVKDPKYTGAALRPGAPRPWDFWQVIHTNHTSGKKSIYQEGDEAACDAYMDSMAANIKAQREMWERDFG